MKILFSTDHHIKLGQKQVPKEWQKNRFLLLGDRLNELYHSNQCDLHIIGGDLLDVPTPTSEEVELLEQFMSRLCHPGMIYTGNHEMLSKTISCLYHLSGVISKVTNGNWEVLRAPYRSPDFDIVPYDEIHKDKWKEPVSKLCFTHVRGEIPPHVKPEIDLNKYSCYDLVIAGDLHSFKNSQSVGSTEIKYPGSPMTTSFHRERTKGTNGCFIIDTESHSVEWIELGDLPQLIRKTIEFGEEMIPSDYDRVVYEVTGNVLELKSIKGSELLDKRINSKVTKDAKLDLADKTLIEELHLFLSEVQKLDKSDIDRILAAAGEYIK